MHIALDATPLTAPTGGVRRYTAEMCRALAANFPDDVVWLVSDQPFDNPVADLANVKTGRGPRNPVERRWWSWGLQAELSRVKADIFHGTDFAVPYLPVKPSVLMFHDLSPWLDPHWHSQADRVRQRTPMLLRLGLATMLLTPSEAVRQQVIERFSVAPGRVVTVPEAASCLFRPLPASTPSQTPYFVYVGTLEPRKNLLLLIDAWREVRKTATVDLVLAGRRREDFPELPEEPGLHLLGAVPDERLPQLYAGAVASVYPSLYEGFGLPVLEAMQCGAAVFTSTDPALREVVGDAAVCLDPANPSAWTEAMRHALEEPAWICGLREKSLRRAALFSWANTAAQTKEVYVEAIVRFRKRRPGSFSFA